MPPLVICQMSPFCKTARNLMWHNFTFSNPLTWFPFFIADDSPLNPCDVDNGRCEHFCENHHGMVNCLCDAGYQLHSNGTSCVGKICLNLLHVLNTAIMLYLVHLTLCSDRCSVFAQANRDSAMIALINTPTLKVHKLNN